MIVTSLRITGHLIDDWLRVNHNCDVDEVQKKLEDILDVLDDELGKMSHHYQALHRDFTKEVKEAYDNFDDPHWITQMETLISMFTHAEKHSPVKIYERVHQILYPRKGEQECTINSE